MSTPWVSICSCMSWLTRRRQGFQISTELQLPNHDHLFSISPLDCIWKSCSSLPSMPIHTCTHTPGASAAVVPMAKHTDVVFPCQHFIHHSEFLSRSQHQILFRACPAISYDQLQLPNRDERLWEDKSTSIPKVLREQWQRIYSTLGWFIAWVHSWCIAKRGSLCRRFAHASASVVTGMTIQMANISWTGNHITNVMLGTNRKCVAWCNTFLFKLELI